MATQVKNKVSSVRINEVTLAEMNKEGIGLQDVFTAYQELASLVGPTKAIKFIRDRSVIVRFETITPDKIESDF